MKKAWKPVIVFLLFFLLVTTVMIYSRISAIAPYGTTTQGTNLGPGKFGCIKCQHKPHAVIRSASATPDDYLYAVAATSNTSAWAVGVSDTTGPDKALIEHWDGQLWSAVPAATAGVSADLYGVAAISTTDAWAVGDYYPTATAYGQTLIEHWTGTVWNVVPSPNGGTNLNYLNDVTAISSNNVWAVGIENNVSSLIEHWDGKVEYCRRP